MNEALTRNRDGFFYVWIGLLRSFGFCFDSVVGCGGMVGGLWQPQSGVVNLKACRRPSAQLSKELDKNPQPPETTALFVFIAPVLDRKSVV